jgi:hypothetical protein
MNKMSNNLMLINKIILFNKSMLDEDIDPEFFIDKINFDLRFINSNLDNIWIEYLKFKDIYSKDDLLKTYSFTLKRFYNLLDKIIKDVEIIKNFKLENSMIVAFINNIKNKMELISEHNSRATLLENKEQCINEEEYMLLFNDDDQSGNDK